MKSVEHLLSRDDVCDLLVDGSHAIVRDLDGTILAWTAGAERIYGWTREEVVGRTSHTLLKTVFPAPLNAINAELRRTGRWIGELIHTRKDKETIVVQSSWRSVLGKDGEHYVIEVNNEITALARAREQLVNSERRLSVAIEVAQIGIWDWNPTTNESVCSEEYFVQLGVPPAKNGPSYEEWLSRVHPDDRDRIAQEMSQAICTPNVFDTEFRILRPDGSHRWLHTRAHTIFRDGQCARMIGANIDITDRKHFEERLQEINRSLQQSNEDLEHFAHAAGHDLQEPLRTVSTCTALLSRRLNAVMDERAREYLAFIENSSKRMHDMLYSLLEYARRTGAGSSIPLEQTSAEKVVQNAITTLRLLIEETNAYIALDPLPEICANPELLAQVFQNLISNAIKYRRAEQPPHIRISASQCADKWTFAVSDNGIGFDPQHKTSIFQLFKRLANANVAGNGIGLAVSKRIIEKHGGRMWAESEPGHGSTFYFSVPAISKRIQTDVSHT